ncbi:MAG TPA: hypothetical protein VNZ52_12000, partial [Candidatus Thermoplasmatota archaeon]|nr:hypothetical protein [Candidatus Thermoplasmatota archaeon]
YEQSKLEAHLLVMGADDLNPVLPMPGVIVGPHGPLDRVMTRLARNRLPLIPGGDGPTGVVHVKDVAEGICLAAEKGKGPYLLVEENLRMEELLGGLAKTWGCRLPKGRIGMGPLMAAATVTQAAFNLVGKAPPLSREHVVSLRASMRYTSEKAKRELGWQPRMWEHFREERAFYTGTTTA